MTLRDRLIEAILRTIDDWPTVGTPGYKGLDGGAVLDTMLVVLADNADEWERQVDGFAAATQVYGEAARRLLAVLEVPGDS